MNIAIDVFKALSDNNRLQIIDMISCGELCACEIMDRLSLTQPTISHHMNILQKANLVNSKKEGKWVRYSLNKGTFDNICTFIKRISSDKGNCICKTT